jgi:hypothetical protein
MYSLLEKNGKWYVFTNVQGRDWYYGGYTSKILAQLLLEEMSVLEVA